ncbi:NAD(P)-binding protein [Xylariaceae sp. AK1471]|nr:NAD(P)-binding protein [Xylariaceae sp. AK1471]
MSSYVITGASRGLGFAFLRELSSDPNNTVVGLVRNVASTEEKVSAELAGRSNIHILAGDLTNHEGLKAAAEQVSAITGGKLDYLIANAAYIPTVDGYCAVRQIAPKDAAEQFRPAIETNVIGNLALYQAFLPLILQGKVKKVVCITTGMADVDFINQYDVEYGALYSASKGALNVINAKFSAQYKKQGVLFLGISPGVVDTGYFTPETMSPEDIEGLQGMLAVFLEYAPHFKGPVTPEVAVRQTIKVYEDASIEKGFGGKMVSQFGNKQWL